MKQFKSAPNVVCADSELLAKLIAEAPAFRETLVYSWFTRLWIVQILLYMLRRKEPAVQYEREFIHVGNDVIALDWPQAATELPEDAPFALLFPTLVGGSSEMNALVARLQQEGYHCAVLIRRGHDGLPLHTPSWNMMGKVEDVEAAVTCIQQRFPNASLFFVGCSAGTGLAANYLAHKKDSPVVAQVLQSPGYDLVGTFSNIHWFISMNFLVGIKKKVLWRHREVLKNSPRFWYALLCCWNMKALFQNLWGVGGFESFEHMLEETNPIRLIPQIDTPTLCVNTHDDPACSWSCVPHEIFAVKPNGVLLSALYGGHVGGYPEISSEKSWFIEATVQFLAQFQE